MSDLVKRAREFDSYDHAKANNLIDDLADEIERLYELKGWLYELKESYKDQMVKGLAAPRAAVLDDMREWANAKRKPDGKGGAVAKFLTDAIDAYEKDKLK